MNMQWQCVAQFYKFENVYICVTTTTSRTQNSSTPPQISRCTLPRPHPWLRATAHLFSTATVLPLRKSYVSRIKEYASSWDRLLEPSRTIDVGTRGNSSFLFNICGVYGHFPSLVPVAGKLVFFFLPPYNRFINFIDSFKEPAFHFLDSTVLLFSISLIPPPAFMTSFPSLAVGSFSFYTVPMLHATSLCASASVSR